MDSELNTQIIGTGPYPTTLAKRKTAITKKEYFKTFKEQSYPIAINTIKKRTYNTKGQSIFGFGLETPICQSFVTGDFVCSWADEEEVEKDPNAKDIDTLNVDMTEVKSNNKFFVDEAAYDKNKNYDPHVWTAFNGIKISDWIKYYNRSLGPTGDDVADINNINTGAVYAFENSDQLMKSLRVHGMIYNNPLVIRKDILESPQNKLGIITVLERGLMSFPNCAHSDDEDDFQNLWQEEEVEWFIPYFNQRSTDVKDRLFTYEKKVQDGKTHWEPKMTNEYKEKWKKCIIGEYKDDGRFTLLYRKYNPKNEKKILKDTVEKLVLSVKTVDYILNKVIGPKAKVALTTSAEVSTEAANVAGANPPEYVESILTTIGKYNLPSGGNGDYTNVGQASSKKLEALKLDITKKILLEKNEKIHFIRRRIFARIKKSSPKLSTTGEWFIDFYK